jgi:hypothetical protein
MSLLFKNNAISTLASGISDSALSLTVQAGDGALFPNPTGNDSFLVTLQDASNNIEIVSCTGVSTDTLTIVRAQDDTSALTWLADDAVELRISAAVLSQYRQGVGDRVLDTAINLALGLIHVHDIINCTASGITIDLGDAGTMAEGYQVTVKNSAGDGGIITLGRTTGGDTINGVTGDVNIPDGASVYVSINEAEDGYITLGGNAEASYPVGSAFFSGVATNPNILLGFGTWAAIPGRFIVGVGDNGDGKTYSALGTGGSKDAVNIDHDHPITDPGHTHGASGARENGNVGSRFGNTSRPEENTLTTNSATTGITIDSSGVDGTDLNLVPFFGLYIWRRTA